MTYGYVMKNLQFMDYLGFCEQKGFMYSEYMGDGQYRILALNNGTVTTMIRFEGEVRELREYETVSNQ